MQINSQQISISYASFLKVKVCGKNFLAAHSSGAKRASIMNLDTADRQFIDMTTTI